MADDFDDLLADDDEEMTAAPSAVSDEDLLGDLGENDPEENEAAPSEADDDDLLGDLDDDDEPAAAVVPEPVAEAPKKRGRPRKVVAPVEPEESLIEALAEAVQGEIAPTFGEVAKAQVAVGAPPTAPVAPVGETDIQRQIREAKEELAKPVYVPANELSEEELELRALKDQLAVRDAKAFADAPALYAAPSGSGEIILLHFVRDGLTVNGEMTYRGQEMEFEVGGVAYEQTKNKDGFSPFSKEAIEDIDGQYSRWGDEFVKLGPWRGKSWAEATPPTGLKADELAEWKQGIERAAVAEKRRNRAAPIQQTMM